MKNSFLWFLLLCPGALHCYFLNEDIKTWSPSGDTCDNIPLQSRVDCGWPGISGQTCRNRGCCYNDEIANTIWCFYPIGDLFGWSMSHFKEDLYVGAPLENQENGALYKCSNLERTPSCQKKNSPSNLKPGAWYGSTLAAAEQQGTLYSCAFKDGHKLKSTGRYTGSCYALSGSSMNPTPHVTFIRESGWRKSYTTDPASDSKWIVKAGGTRPYANNLYGRWAITATVDERGKLIIGGPTIAFDQKGYFNRNNGQSKWKATGNILKIDRRNLVKLPNDDAPWGSTDADLQSQKNAYKRVGFSLTNGNFFNDGIKSIVTGAPQTDNFLGAVYVCHDCFNQRRGGINHDMKLQPLDLKQGEDFGYSVAACDITGDGRDDLIVGSPSYAEDQFHYNVGRLHVFVFDTRQNNLIDKRNTIDLNGPLDEINGAKFGYSVACLGLTDKGSEGRKMVAVGAPYYGVNNQGAVFVYRTKYGTEELELSQTVLPSNSITTSFGMKLSDVLENNSGVARGFGIAAPEADVMTYVRARPVVRFRDDTRIEVTPTSIDPRKNAQITLSVQPKVVKLSNYNKNIDVKVTVTTDTGRLTSSQGDVKTTTLSRGNTLANKLEFQYALKDSLIGDSNLNLDDPNYSPISFSVQLEYSLPSCLSTYENPCPTFDPKDDKDGKNPDGTGQKIFQKAQTTRIEFNVCANPQSCQCKVETQLKENNEPIVAGEKTVFSFGELVLTNTGSEPSIQNILEIEFDSTKYHFVDVGNWRCNYPGNSQSKVSCSLPYLDKSGSNYGSRTIPLELELKNGNSLSSDVRDITMSIKLSSECPGQPVLLERSLTVPVEHHWTMKAAQSPDQSEKIISWNSQDEDDPQATEALLTYELFNTGPSMTEKSTIFVYIPSQGSTKGLLKDVRVTYDDAQCTVGDVERTQRPPGADTSAEEDTKVLSCTNVGTCDVYECAVPSGIDKDIASILNINFSLDKTKAEASETEDTYKVITSLCTMGHDSAQVCVQNRENVLQTITKFEYDRGTFLDAIVSKWQYIVGAAAALVVIIIIFIIFYKCGIFQKVRFNKAELEEAKRQSVAFTGQETENL